MCTVVLRVPEPGDGDVRILAVRDEDPHRPWRPLGHWWPERPGVRGVLDELAGGAWLAHDDSRLAVLLNRAGGSTLAVPSSRGSLVLDAVAGRGLPDPLTTLGFNLVRVENDSAVVTSWEEGEPRTVELAPGTHMVAHEDVDDPRTARVAAWLDAFAAAPTEGEAWWEGWFDVLRQTTSVGPLDDRAIVRDNRPHGFPTQSLLVCAASVGPRRTTADMVTLERPGVWNELNLRGSRPS